MIFPAAVPRTLPRRVVITGAGIITALGAGWKSNAEGFRAGRAAFRPVSLFDVSRHRVRTAAEVELPPMPKSNGVPRRQMQRMDRAGRMLLLSAGEAWQQAGWERADDIPFVLGTTAGGMTFGEAYYRQAIQAPLRHRQQPTRALHYQPQVQARMVQDILGFAGPITIISNACASGGNAVGQGWRLVRRGQAERLLAGGYEALNELVFSGFDALQALSPTVCRPFDVARDGLALGEGSAVLALESLDHARRRKASILGELVGYGTAIDLHHLTQPNPQGDTALAVMNLACAAGGVPSEAVDYINAHGTGTPLNDSAEALAIRRWAGTRAAELPVSSTKACVGHLLGAAGAVEAVVCLMTLREQWLPPEPAFENPDPACNFQIVRQPQDARLRMAMSNSFGFGGVNATLLFRRWV